MFEMGWHQILFIDIQALNFYERVGLTLLLFGSWVSRLAAMDSAAVALRHAPNLPAQLLQEVATWQRQQHDVESRKLGVLRHLPLHGLGCWRLGELMEFVVKVFKLGD